jgi:MFS family permease
MYVAALVLSLGRGAWFTCWAIYFIRSVGLSPTQFGVGVTLAGLVGLVSGGPLGYLADRLGARETLIVLGAVEGLAVLSYAAMSDFRAVLLATCVVVAVERATPGIRVALISGLTGDADRLSSIATSRVLTQAGIVVGALAGTVVLSLDSTAGYRGLVVVYGAVNIAFALLMLRVPHVTTLRERATSRGVLVLRDRPFLLLTLFNGLLALSWGMLDSGVPLWITHHTRAATWVVGVLVGLNAIVNVLFQRRFIRAGATVRQAARLGLWAGLALAVSCAAFAASYRGSGAPVVAVLVLAAAIHVVGEMLFVGSGLGLSVGLTPDDAHGEYQGMFSTGQAAAMMLAPGVMATLLVGWSYPGWFVLALLFALGGVGTMVVGRWAVRTRERPSQRQEVSRISHTGAP